MLLAMYGTVGFTTALSEETIPILDGQTCAAMHSRWKRVVEAAEHGRAGQLLAAAQTSVKGTVHLPTDPTQKQGWDTVGPSAPAEENSEESAAPAIASDPGKVERVAREIERVAEELDFKLGVGKAIYLKQLATQHLKIATCKVAVVDTNGLGRGLKATEHIRKDQLIALFLGDVAINASGNKEVCSGEAVYAVSSANTMVSLSHNAADRLVALSKTDSTAAVCVACFANHSMGGGRGSNCTLTRVDPTGDQPHHIFVLQASQDIAEGGAVIANYGTGAPGPMKAQLQADTRRTRSAISQVLREFPEHIREVPPEFQDDATGVWRFDQPTPSILGVSGGSINPSTFPRGGNGLFLTTRALEQQILTDPDCWVVKSVVGNGFLCLHVAASIPGGIAAFKERCSSLFPTFKYFIERALDSPELPEALRDTYLLGFPPSALHMAALFAVNASGDGQRYGRSLCGHLELIVEKYTITDEEPSNHFHGARITQVHGALHAKDWEKAWALSANTALSRKDVEICGIEYVNVPDNPEVQVITEADRREIGENPWVAVYYNQGRCPHRSAVPTIGWKNS